MKKIHFFITFLVLGVAWVACQKGVLTEAKYSDYLFATLDTDGGSWQTTLIDSPEDITIADPELLDSAAYQAELATLRNQTNSLTAEQKNAVAY